MILTYIRGWLGGAFFFKQDWLYQVEFYLLTFFLEIQNHMLLPSCDFDTNRGVCKMWMDTTFERVGCGQ